MSRAFRVGIRLGLLAGVLVVVWRAVQSRRSPEALSARPDEWPPIPPAPARPTPAATGPEGAEEAPAPAPSSTVVSTPAPAPATAKAAPKTAPAAATAPKPTPPPAKATATPSSAPPAKKAAAPAKAAKATKKSAAPVAWVEPSGTLCPETHPVKAKLSSKLFHVPGGFAYKRTTPDRCYASPEAAEADGLTQSRR